jgi:hypothetical protein
MGSRFYRSNQTNMKTNKKQIQFGSYRLCKQNHLGKFKKRWFGPLRAQYCLPSNIILPNSINNFEPNPILVDVNMLKSYTYVG